jgi:hypothetical protein
VFFHEVFNDISSDVFNASLKKLSKMILDGILQAPMVVFVVSFEVPIFFPHFQWHSM